MYGYFCFEAERRGANRVVGIDIDLENITKCRTIAAIKGSGCEFLNCNFERYVSDETFDYVLCFNVLNHLRNPILGLDMLLAMTTERLILEIASFSGADRRKSRVSTMIAPLLDRLPIIYLGDSRVGERRLDVSPQTFFITRRASEALLLGHRRSLARLEYVDEGHKGFYTLIAHKRRLKHVIIVAGVTTSGKSTLMKQLMAGQHPIIADRIGFDANKDWTTWSYGMAGAHGVTDNVIIHCNITQHLIDGDVYRYDNALLDLIGVAETVSVVTIWCSPSQLATRYEAERANTAAKWKYMLLRRTRRQKKNLKFPSLLANEQATLALFADWFNFVKRHVEQGVVVIQEDNNRVIDIAEWEGRYGSRASFGPIGLERGTKIA
jgi:hypothetical protein